MNHAHWSASGIMPVTRENMVENNVRNLMSHHGEKDRIGDSGGTLYTPKCFLCLTFSRVQQDLLYVEHVHLMNIDAYDWH